MNISQPKLRGEKFDGDDDDDDDDDDDNNNNNNNNNSRDTRWRSWLRHCATSRKVTGSIPDGDIGIFQLT